MAAPVDSPKIWKLFKRITDEKLDPDDYEEFLSGLNRDELLLLRKFAVQARCTTIASLAQKGWPQQLQKPN